MSQLDNYNNPSSPYYSDAHSPFSPFRDAMKAESQMCKLKLNQSIDHARQRYDRCVAQNDIHCDNSIHRSMMTAAVDYHSCQLNNHPKF